MRNFRFVAEITLRAAIVASLLLSQAMAAGNERSKSRGTKDAISPPAVPDADPKDDVPAHIDLRQAYSEAIMRKIRSSWTRPAHVSTKDVCPIRVQQLPGGLVIEATVMPECPYDTAARQSAEAAILRAQPLPYAGFEPVFSRVLVLRFRAAD
ncbi:MAG: cell envelope integrity protein TolA [Xanthomonadaceae bacterium]|nr:cell envelope integrity protein TolA [Xanthomonadaceae bacterium]